MLDLKVASGRGLTGSLYTCRSRSYSKPSYATPNVSDKTVIHIPKAHVYRFGDSNARTPIFSDLDWTVREGECWAVVGSNAGEKTALFQTLLGHMRISPAPPPPYGLYPFLSIQGRDPFAHVSIVSFGNRSRASGGAFYDYTARYGAARDEERTTLRESMFPDMIQDKFVVRPNTDENDDAEQQRNQCYFEELADRMGLTPFLDLPFVALSNGQTRRARVIKAILSKPELLLLDEPLTGLDVQTRLPFLSLLHQLHLTRKPRIILGLRSQDSIPEWVSHLALVAGPTVHAGPINTRPHDTRQPGKNGSLDNRLSVEISRPKIRPNQPLYKHAELEGKVLVDMKNVSVRYDQRMVLNKINWQIRQGERWHLAGANGSGKTTLLSLITGDHPQSYTQFSTASAEEPNPPDRHLRLFSTPRSRIPTPILHARIGIVSPELFDAFPRRQDMSVWEAVVSGFEGVFCVPYMAGKGKGSGEVGVNVGGRVGEELSEGEKAWRIKRMWDVIEGLGPAAWERAWQDIKPLSQSKYTSDLTRLSREFAERPFPSLSAGEQRMVLLMRALVGRPQLILLDEVWSGMDQAMVHSARKYMRNEHSMNANGISEDQAVVVITHWEDEVPWNADEGVKTLVLQGGQGRVLTRHIK